MTAWKMIWILGAAATVFGDIPKDLTVTTNSGTVSGTILTGVENDTIYSFLGIPFAEPPVGGLRFKPPQSAKPWSGILDATQEGPYCAQNDIRGLIAEEEDCLFINVHTPQRPDETANLPVMVFIHGGGFLFGSGSPRYYGPGKLVSKQVILVTFNYRLGIFGFLSTEDEAAPGNIGMLDQVAALRWVQDNIVHFGGDPNRVTIFGESAGGASVSYHILSTLSKGLFQNAIIMSGSPLAFWAVERNARVAADNVAKEVGCPTEKSQLLIDCLRTVPVKNLLEAEKNQHVVGFFPLVFTPIIEKPLAGAGFLTEEPKKILEEGRLNKANIMIGVVKDEGIFEFSIVNPMYTHEPRGFLNERLPQIISILTNIQTNLDEISESIASRYFNQTDTEEEIITQAIQVYSDAHFKASVSAEAILHARSNVNPYVYLVSHGGPFTLGAFFGLTKNYGVCHTDELQYIFSGNFFVGSEPQSPDDVKTGELIRTTWTNFAKYGRPTLADDPVQWIPLTSSEYQYFDINPEPVMRNGLLTDAVDFWMDEIPSLAHKATETRKKTEL